MSFSLIYIVLLLLGLLGFHGCEGRRIIAVGDLHGDLNQTLSVLRLAGVIDDRKHWIGGDTYFVQLGDVLDVGPDDIAIVRLFMKLEKEAKDAGGDVIQVLGNHEIRNLLGDYTAVDPLSLAYSGGKRGRRELLSNKTDLGMYLRTRKAVFHYKEYLFMHGGLSLATSTIITTLSKVEEFNNAVRAALVNATQTAMGREGLNLNEDNVDVKNPILVRTIRNVRCEQLIGVLEKNFAGIKSVVVGHVPHNPEDFSDWRLCDGRLIDIDFGLSRWKKGNLGSVAVLEIDDVMGNVMLVESNIELPQFKPDVHGLDSIINEYRSHSVVKLVSLAVLIAMALITLCILIFNCCRTKPFAEDSNVDNYGACA